MKEGCVIKYSPVTLVSVYWMCVHTDKFSKDKVTGLRRSTW